MEDRSPSHVCLGMLATSLQKHKIGRGKPLLITCVSCKTLECSGFMGNSNIHVYVALTVLVSLIGSLVACNNGTQTNQRQTHKQSIVNLATHVC